MSGENFQSEWTAKGYFVVPQLFDARLIRELKVICDDVFQLWLAESADPQKAANQTNMAYLTELRYFERQPERLNMLLGVIAHEKILHIFRKTFDVEPLFHNTQYFFEPASVTRSGDWHRDQQFGAPNVEAEKAAMSQKGFHAHIAFVPDDNLEIVPCTHARWDTQQEFEIRKGINGRAPNADDMPGAVRISLEAGDACFFSAWSIHRGNYVNGKVRRTFDVIYAASASDEYTPPPMCFSQSEVLDGLSGPTRLFFQRFINAYKEKWKRSAYEY
ncbi:MAG: phytanoyl-CoA dioxygenase family protein [Pyrinomonadaceae bacterium]